MRLIIAEKPSVAQSIANVLGAFTKRNGYLEGNAFLVSWCYGHLAELAEADFYDSRYAKWKRDDLPIFPMPFQFQVQEDKRRQFQILKNLMHREDVTEVINACDSGREGELIFRTAYYLADCQKPMQRLWISSMEDTAIRQGLENLHPGRDYDGLYRSALCRTYYLADCQKPMQRLWISSMEDTAIRQGLENLHPGRDYDGLYRSALCRTKADWLVGINATRFFSLTYGTKLPVGRVLSPTLSLLVQREEEISAFVPETYYTVELEFPEFTAVSEKLEQKEDADFLAQFCPHQQIVVSHIQHWDKEEKPPALYDLTTLQRDANRLLGYTAQQTLDYLQALYEKKLCTYPRTDSRYLTDDMLGSVPAMVLCAAGICNKEAPSDILAQQVCNSQKVSDHHAILPTMAAGEQDISSLPKAEQNLLTLISRQVLMAVSGAYRYREVEITLTCGTMAAGEQDISSLPKAEQNLLTLISRQVLMAVSGAYRYREVEITLTCGEDFLVTVKKLLDAGWKKFGTTSIPQKWFPELAVGQVLPSPSKVTVKKGRTQPPRHFTEDLLLAAMETAGNQELPEDAERKGLGTPATRAGILEKLVSSGMVERYKAQKRTILLPTSLGRSLIAILVPGF